MTTGDQADIVGRLKRQLPISWFAGGETPILDTVLNGIAAPLSWGYQFYAYTLLQMRLGSATGVWIDRISYDFLGNRLPRRNPETDAAYRARVKAEIMRPRLTRAAIVQAVEDLTGRPAQIFEPWNPGDTGAYGYAMGYGCAGCYGSLAFPNQVFVTALRPLGAGIPKVPGYGVGPGGYGKAGEYTTQSQVQGAVTDADIYQAVAQTKAAGIRAWTAILSAPNPILPDSAGNT